MSTNKDLLRWVAELEEEVENDGYIEGSSEVSDEEYYSDMEENDGDSSDYYLGKNKLTKWRKTEARMKRGRTAESWENTLANLEVELDIEKRGRTAESWENTLANLEVELDIEDCFRKGKRVPDPI
ncbi:hypothetical protein QE152_g36831 [Popillia japonica]|uniref:Uncharacterized protein n=1 Tax=Popillia japonica TaxID=7064 RepID=A0AAW1ICG0_POPJA